MQTREVDRGEGGVGAGMQKGPVLGTGPCISHPPVVFCLHLVVRQTYFAVSGGAVGHVFPQNCRLVDATYTTPTAGAGYVSDGIQEPAATARIAASLRPG